MSVLHWFTPSYYPLVSFVHYFVCPSLIYVLLLPLGIFCQLFCLSFIDLRLLITPWYLLSIILSVLHWLTSSYYPLVSFVHYFVCPSLVYAFLLPLGIFCPLFCLSFIDLRLLITPWYLLSIIVSVLHWFTPFYYPLVSFVHYFVCPSLIYVFLLPLGIFCPLFCLSFIDLRLLITPWYLLSIILFVLHWFTPSYYPSVSFVRYFVCPSLIYAFLLALGIFCPLFFLSFIDSRLLITPWYLLSIALSVRHWFTPSYYPLVSFVHCFFCPSLIHAFLLPLGIFCPLLCLSCIDLRLLITPWYLLSIILSVLHWFTPSYYPLVSFVLLLLLSIILCPSLIYAFLLPLGIFCPLFFLSFIDSRLLITPWHLLSIALSVRHWFTPSYYPLVSFVHCFVRLSLTYIFLLRLGIFCPLFFLSFIDLPLLITPWYLLSIALSVLHWFTPSYYPSVSFVHYFVRPSLIYAFLLPLGIFCPLFCLSFIDLRLLITPWYLLSIIVSVLHWFTPSYYPLVSFVHYFVCPSLIYVFLLPLGIFCPLFCLSFIDLRLLITPWYLLSIIVSVLHWFTSSYYPLVSFVHYCVCPSLIYAFLLPLCIFCPLFCLSFIDLRPLITPWYLLSIILFVLHWFTPSYYPLVSFVHYFVCPSLIYVFLLPLGIFCPLFCLSFIDWRLLITPWYLLSIILSVLHWFTPSYYPLVSFVHYCVCPSLIYVFLLPLGIFCPLLCLSSLIYAFLLPLGIFCPLFCLSFIDLRLLITPWYLLSIILFVLHWFTPSYYPLVSFVHYFVCPSLIYVFLLPLGIFCLLFSCPSLIYAFLLPLGIFCPLFCLSFIDLRLLITPWYLLSIIVSVLHWFTSSYYPLVSFVHYCVCPSLIYAFLLPLGIFCPLFCLSFIDLRLLITPWYLLSIILFVLHWFTPPYYPLISFVHYFVCPSLIYIFLLPLGIFCPLFCLSFIGLRLLITPWYLLSIILSVLHWFTSSYYPLVSFVHYCVCPSLIYAFLLPLGIFCPLFCLSFIDLRLLITPWYLLSIILFVLHWFTPSYYPLVSFVHYFVCPSLIYAFLLPLGIFCPLFCLSFIDLRLLITPWYLLSLFFLSFIDSRLLINPWYLLSIALSVRHWFTPSYYPLVSFVHYFVCPSLIYAFLLPLGFFCPLFFLSFIDSRLLITAWYLLSIALSVLHWFTPSYYPLVSFVHYFVCPSLIYAFLLPLGIFCPLFCLSFIDLRLLITPRYLLSIILSVLHWFTPSYYPLVSFVHCFFCPSLIHAFLLPLGIFYPLLCLFVIDLRLLITLGIFCPLFCPPFIDLHLLITPWYLLSIAFSVLHWFTPSYYPLVSFVHCFVCPSLIYAFLLPLGIICPLFCLSFIDLRLLITPWYLLSIVFSVLHWFTPSYYRLLSFVHCFVSPALIYAFLLPLGIFCPLFCLSFIDLRLLITPWYLFSIILFVLHWFTPSYYPSVSCVHYFVCPSLIYAFLLPLGIFCPLFFLSFIDSRLLITPWYLLSIALSVRHWFTPSYYPLVSFVHCFFCPSLIHAFLLPLGIFCPLLCLSCIDLRLLITPWYLLSIILSVLHWFTPSYYPLVSFVHYFVCPSLIYAFLLPLGIFCPLFCLSFIDLRLLITPGIFCPLFFLSFIDSRLLITAWHLLSIALSVRHWFTPSYYPLVSFVHCFVRLSLTYIFLLRLDIFCPLLFLSFIDLPLLITPWYLLSIALSVLHWFTPSYYRLVSFVHCFFCPSLIHAFLLPLVIFCPLLCLSCIDLRLLITAWYLLSIILSVLHWFTPSYYPLVSFFHYFVCPSLIYAFLLPLGIFCPLFCLSFIDLRLLITPWYLLSIVFSVIHWFTPSYYPLVSFVHCFVCPSLIYAFLLPLGIFCPLFCLSFIDLRLLITPWFLLSIVFSVLHWFTPSYYPLVSFVHYFVCPSLVYAFLLPLGIFCPLFCLSFIDLRLLITPWYLLSIIVSVLHWFTPSYYPLVSFVHYFVCPSLIYVFLLPLGIFCPLFCFSFIDLRLLITPWYLLSIILFVLHWFTPSYYPSVSFVRYFVCPSLIYAFLLPLGIFCPLFFLSFIDSRLLITAWYLLSIALSVLHWFTPSYYRLVSFVHYFVCPSLIYAFLLPLGIFCPLFCLSFIDLRLLITPWYLLSIILSVLHWFTPSYYPLVSFVHCFFCPSFIHAFLLPLGIFYPLLCLFVIDLRLLITLGIFCPLFCPPFIDLHLLITPWYLLSIAFSVLHWFTPSYYPLVSFVHCFVCPSLIYAFLLPLGIICPLFCLSFIDLRLLITPWYLLSIVFSVLHWFTPSYYRLLSFVHCFVSPALIYAFLLPLGIFCPLFCLSFIDLRLLITPWYLLSIVFSVIHWFTPSYYPLVSFVHCFVCPSLIYAFLLPLGIFCPLFCLSFIDLRLLITPWFLLSIVFSVLHWFTPSYYRLVSFVHCFVCPALIYAFLLPLGIFCPLFCLSFIDLRLLITPWYLLSIILFVLHWFTPSYYPSVSFVHYFVCPSLIYAFLLPLVSFVHCFFCPSLIHAFLLPLGIFYPLLCLFVIDLRLLITPWYLLSIVLSVFHWLTSSYYALVSFVHCFFCPSLIYPFLLPLGIFCPLLCLSFIDLRLLITAWYLLSIILSVLHWFTPSYYPLVSFVHCFFCPSLIHAFLLPLGIFCPLFCLSFIGLRLLITPWYLLSIILSVLHWFTSSYYPLVSFVHYCVCPSLIYAFLLPLGIFCPLFCLSFIDLRLLITPWYLLSIILFVLHWFTPSYYPLVSFVHYFVCPSLIYAFLLPLGIFCPLFCLSFIDLRLLITPWYLLSIVFSVLHWFTPSYYRLVSFVHCFVCPALIYAFLLPLGIFCPLFCLSFIDLRLLITPWYLLSIILFVLHWFTPSYYPSVSFVHYFVCPSLIYAFLLPLGIFCPLFFLSFIHSRLLITAWHLLSIALSVRHWFTPSYYPWYLLSIVLSVFHWLTSSYYALVSFVHCFFCPSLIYPFLLPLGIFCPLLCLSFIDLRLLITAWYHLSIILSVLHWFTPSYYPMVSFVHCFFCPSLIHAFLLPLVIFCPLLCLSCIDLRLLITAWYLLSIILSVLHWFTPSYYPLVSFFHYFVCPSLIYAFLLPLGILCPLFCLSFIDLRLLITPWYLLSIVFSVIHWFTPSYYPLVSFVHCFVCPSLIYAFLLPLGIFCPLFCLSFIDLRLLITPWFLLSIVFSVLHWFTPSYYRLVSFVHCFVCPALIYAFLLPLGIFCPLFCLSFIDLRLLITPWYLLSIILFVLHWFTPSYYPSVSFVHYFVCPSLIYAFLLPLVSFVHCFFCPSLIHAFLLPLGIFYPLLCLFVIDLRLLITPWYLLSIVLSVFHWLTSSYYALVSFVHCFFCPSLIYPFLLPLGIFCPLLCLSFIDLRLLITAWYLLSIILSVLHWFTPSYYPMVSFVHCFFCPSLIHAFLLPLVIFCPLLCLSCIDLRLLITAWYLLSIILSVLHWFTPSYYPLVSFFHYFVCPSLIYAFLLPLGIFCPLFCLSCIDLRLLITAWYLLSIILSVLHWFTPSYYPLVSFVHYFVCPSLIYAFLLPLGIFCPLFFLSFIDSRLLITAWHLLSIALSVRHWFTPSYYPLVSFVHCFVRLSLTYIFLLRLGIFCPLLFLSFIDLPILITPWYLLSIALSVLHWFTPSYYRLVSFVHYFVCPSLIYAFLLPHGIFCPLFFLSFIDSRLLITACYLLSIALSLLHWFTPSYYRLVSFVHYFVCPSLIYAFLLPLGIFFPLFCLSFIDLRLLITTWYLLSIVLFVCHWFTPSYYPLVSFVHYFVCPSLIYAFLLPLGIFCPLFCLSFIDLRLLITPWYLLSIVFSVLHWFTPSYYRLVSFVHCFVCPALIYAFLLPLGIFCPLFCLSFIDLRLLITPWYLLSIILFVLHWFTPSYYPSVSFVHYFVCPSLIYAFLLPLGIFCPLFFLSFIHSRLLITAWHLLSIALSVRHWFTPSYYPWYLLSIVLSVFHWLTSSYYALVSFVHCFFCPSLIYPFLLPLGIFCPLLCLSFIDLRLLITAWYHLSIILSVLHWFTPSYYPMVSFVHCFFCPSLIHAFLLPLVIFCPLLCLSCIDLRLLITAWYLLSIILSVLHWFTPSYYPLVSFFHYFVCPSLIYAFLLPLGILCPLFCLSFIDLRLLITPWYLLSIVFSVIHWFTPSYYPLVSFVHCFVCPSLIYAFLLPLGIFCPLFCLSFIDLRLLITPWFLLSIVFSVLHWFTPSYYRLVSFVHCFVCPALIYAFLLPLGIFCPLFCLSFIDLRLLITPWYLLSIILFVLHWFTPSYYPSVSFVHYFVCPSLIYAFLLPLVSFVHCFFCPSLIHAFLLPLGIFYPLLCLFVIDLRLLITPWYLLSIVLSVFHWLTSSYYALVSFVHCFFCPSLIYPFLLPLGIFCPLLCLSFIDLRLLITAWYLLSIILSVLHWFTPSYYPMVSFVHCFFCPSLIHAFLLPLVIFCPLLCLSCIDLRLLITAWYLLSIILSVLHWFTPSYYPLVSFFHYFVCPSLIYAFLLPLGIFCPLFCLSCIDLRLLITAWYLLSIILSVLHWFTPSYYPLVSFVHYFVCPSLIYAFLLPLGIFCPLFCLSFIDLRLLITPWYLLSIVFSVLHWFTPSYYRLASFIHCFVCSSLIYAFLLPLGIFCPLFCPSFIDLHLLITPWYLLSIAFSVLHWFTPSYYPLVSFVHCFVCPSLIYAFLLPLGIFCPLFCLSIIDLRLLITPWYLLSIVFSVLHWFTPSYYRLLSFVHCFVSPALIYAFLLPLGIFCPLFCLSFIDLRLLITPWYLFSIILFVLHWFTPSYYHLVSFVHCFVRLSLIYIFLLPLGIFCPLFFLSFIDLRLLITPWYLLSIALSVFHWIMSSYYPLVSFVHCSIRLSLIYAFLLPLGIFCPLFFLSFINLRLLITPWYLLSIALSVLHWFTPSYYPLVSFVHCFFCPSLIYHFLLPLGIFCPLLCLSVIDLRLLITTWYLLSIVLFVCHWFTSSYYPLVSFVHCFFCPSLIYAFLLPLGIFCPLHCLSFFELCLLITPWYLLSIVLSVCHWFTPSYYPLVSFVHCFFCPSLIYAFLLPLGIFCPLLCLSFIDLRLLITPWYLLSIVLSVFHWLTSSYYPLVSFVHCFVCPSLIYAFLLPLGILCPLFCPSVIDLHLLMTPWYLLSIALSVRHWFTPSYYHLVSCVHCFVRLSLIYIFLWPLGIFCSLLCLSVIDLRLLITPWYLLSIVLSVFHWLTSSYYPLVSFVHCFVCPSLIYAFLLPLGILCPLFCPSVIDLHLLMTPWYLLSIALSVRDWFTPSYYHLVSCVHCFVRLSLICIFLWPLGIFCSLLCLSFNDLRLLITPWYLLSIVFSVFHWLTSSYYPLVSFVHCFFCPSLIYHFLLPLGIFCPLLCLSVSDLRLLITPWYLLSIVLSVCHWFTSSYYPLVSFVHCFVCPSMIYAFLLPLGIFCPLFFLSFIDLRLLITPWYLLSIVLSVFHWIMSSYYPLVSFIHCSVRLSLIYIFLLPLGIFCPLFFPSFIDLHLLITPWYLLSIVFSVFHWLTSSYYPLVSFVHCFFRLSLTYIFLLPLGIFCPLFFLSFIDLRLLITPWYLLSIIVSVLHWFTSSYYPLISFVHYCVCPSLIYAFLLPLGIFCPLFCLSFFDLRLLITPWYLLSIILFVLHWFTPPYYPLVSFVHYFVCPSLIYIFLLPLGIFCPLFCLSFIGLRLLITPWYLLSIILSVLHWFTSSYYPLVSFVHYCVCPSLIYAFLLPLGIFCPLFCLSFIDLRLLITPWYLLSIILFVLHWFTPSYYPLVSFVHYFVCPSLIYAFLLPLGIFCPLFCLSFIDLRLLITPWYLLSIVFSVLHWFTPSY